LINVAIHIAVTASAAAYLSMLSNMSMRSIEPVFDDDGGV